MPEHNYNEHGAIFRYLNTHEIIRRMGSYSLGNEGVIPYTLRTK